MTASRLFSLAPDMPAGLPGSGARCSMPMSARGTPNIACVVCFESMIRVYQMERAAWRAVPRKLVLFGRRRHAERRPVDSELAHAGAERVRVDRQQPGGAVAAFDAAFRRAESDFDVRPHRGFQRGDVRRTV